MNYLQELDTKNLQALIGILAAIVVIYRIIFMMVPMLSEGFKDRDYAKMLKSISLIV